MPTGWYRPEDPADAQPIEDLLQSVLERWQLPAVWSVDGDLHDVPASVLEAASSLIREGVANVAKHAASHDVAVRVHASPREVEVSVEDHGRGFSTTEAEAPVGHLARLPVTDEGVSE